MEKYTFENWLNGKVEYEISRFSPDERKKVHDKSKELIITEADNQFNKEKSRIEKSLFSVPSREKYIQSEIDIIYRILHKDIDYRNDCKRGGLQSEVVYYETGGFEYDIKQIKSIRHHYHIYLQGEINYMGKTLEIDYNKAENIIEAIKLYLMEEWLKGLSKKKKNTELSLQEKALIAIYEKKVITRDQGKIYQHYCKYSINLDRIGNDGDIKTKNKIKRIEKIIPYLSKQAQKQAADEVSILKATL